MDISSLGSRLLRRGGGGNVVIFWMHGIGERKGERDYEDGISPRLRGRTRRIVMRDSALARITLFVAPYVNYLPWDRQSRGIIYRLTRFAACEVFVLSGGPLIRVTPRLWAEDCVGGLVVVQTISRRHMCALRQFCLRTVFGWGEVPKVTLWWWWWLWLFG